MITCENSNFEKLEKEFKAGCSGDWSKEVAGVDSKHKAIYELYSNQEHRKRIANFRNWQGQNDLGVPTQIGSPNQSLIKGIMRYLHERCFQSATIRPLEQGLMDDLALVEAHGFGDLLRDNPVDKTPGATISYRHAGYCFNLRWLRYIYLLGRIRREALLPSDGSWLDVGPYYGGLTGLVLKYFDQAKIFHVDFSHQLCRSYIYLKTLYPEMNHVLPEEVGDNMCPSEVPQGSVVYVPVDRYDAIADGCFDMATNFFSFGEMKRTHFKGYFRSDPFTKSRVVYLVNRFVSAPNFEPTYDSDLDVRDYVLTEKHIRYFDVFPMHQYLTTNRLLFGRKGARPSSSSYFEMIYNNEN